MTQEKTQHYVFNNYGRYPITLVRGEGAYVWDAQGKKYLDFLSGLACTPLGHAHPAVTKAIIEQAGCLLHTSNLYYTVPAADLAEYLVLQGGLDQVFFCNSGAEANEAAIKLARKYQCAQGEKNKFTILSALHSFHGRTFGALAATAKPSIHTDFTPLTAGFKYADWHAITDFCAAIDETTAAVILEPIQGESGIHPALPDFLRAVRAACDKTGTLLIFDEVQCGIGRTGSFFAYQHYDVKPDVITLAKGLANGLPIGAVCALKTVADTLTPGSHGSTFGGNPVACKAALAVLKTLNEENFLARIQALSAYLFAQLHLLQSQYPQHIQAIRGQGLMVGIECKQSAQAILAHCWDNGILVNVAAENVIRLLPPYIISFADIDYFIRVLAQGWAQREGNLLR